MAEYRPYRVANSGARARLTRVKLISVSSFGALALLINWWVTQHAARLFSYAPVLGPSLIGGLYAPWEWVVWWTRWHDVERLQPLWELCTREAAYPVLALGVLAAGTVIVARHLLADDTPDLHGSARWANAREVRASGFLAPSQPLPGWARRLAVRAGIAKPRRPRDGMYLGVWKQGRRRGVYLRDCGPGHVFGYAPTRAGKGVNNIVPTLLVWRHSALIHDFKAELWELTAGARKRMGQLCLRFDPTDLNGGSVKYNPLEEVRLGTPQEAADVQNIVQMLIDPEGRGLNDDHWKETAAPLFTGAILHILYAEPAKTLRGLIGLLSDPGATIDETIQRMLTAVHDPDGSMGWQTFRGEPTRTHPIVAESMREVLNKAEKERASVVSEVGKRLAIYRDPMVAAATEHSEFRISDLMNHERPVSLYLSIPYESRDRLKPVVRLILNQIIHKLTAALAFRDGRPVSPHRRPMLLMLDEFPLLGRFEVFAEAMSHMAGFGLRACLMAQDLTQIYNAYGRNESITSNCDTRVAFTPNKIETAEELSRLIGQASVRHVHRTVSHSGVSVSESEVGRPLMTPDEVRRLGTDEVLIFTRGEHPIRARLLQYYKEPYFKRLSAIKAPAKSDRTITAPPAESRREKGRDAAAVEGAAPANAPVRFRGPGIVASDNRANQNEAEHQAGRELTFLKYGATKRKELV